MLRLDIPIRQAPATVGPLWEGTHLVGRARPARHAGSVDVFLEAFERAEPGDVLVVDNSGRDDEACVGRPRHARGPTCRTRRDRDLGATPRDSTELRSIRLPVFSQGTLPAGPQRLDPQERDALTAAWFGSHVVTDEDFVLGDDDGVLFLPLDRAADIAELAATIRDTERHQAARMNLGTSLRDQPRFADFLIAREQNGTTFRQRLRITGGAIEE